MSSQACGGLIKPDIVFFGENLPVRFFQGMQSDLPECDLLVVMGSSLVVHPFASLIGAPFFSCDKSIFLNME